MENQDIKATIAVHTKYYSFRLAEGLSKLGLLDKLYTLYPKFKIGDYNIPHELIKSFSFLGGLKYFNDRFHRPISDAFLTGFFDNWVAAVLKRPADKWIFDGYNGFCEKSLKKAKKLGAVTFLERPCPHIDMQMQLTREEDFNLLKKKTSAEETPNQKKMKREYDLADYIIVPCLYTQKSFIERGFDPERVIVVPLCNEKDIPFQENKKYPEQFTVLCVGGNFYRLGVYYLLQAWQKMGLTNAKLIIKGAVPNEFSHLTEASNVEVINEHLSDKDMEGFYNRGSIFISPAVDNGFGMAIVEAMRVAMPVIVTDNVGAADILEDGREGFIVPIRDPDALAEKIKYFYDHPDKVKEMGRASLATAKNYTPEKFVERTVEVYRRIFVK